MPRIEEPWESSVGEEESLSNFDKLMSSFCEAASHGDFAMLVYFMVRVSLDPLRVCGKRGWSGRTPLMVACIGSHDDCVAAMTCLSVARHSLDQMMETRDEFGYTALDYACQYRSEKCISILLHAGVPVDSALLSKYRALARAVMGKLGGLIGVEMMASSGRGIEGAQQKEESSTEKQSFNRRLMELTYKVTPWSMTISFVGISLYLLARLLCNLRDGPLASAGFSSTGLVGVMLMVVAVGSLVMKTARSDAGIYVARRESASNVEYGEYIRRECVESDAAAAPKGFRVANTESYRAQLELTRSSINAHCCHICRCWRPSGTRHSKRSGKCIRGFDHFCLFFATDVGQENHTLFLWAICGFNVTLPFLLMDMCLVLIGTQHLLWLPFAAIAKLYSFFVSSSYPSPVVSTGHQEALLAVGCLWLYLIWVFVFLLLVQTLYKQTSKALDLSKKKEH